MLAAGATVRYGTREGSAVVTALILASSLVFIDATALSVALTHVGAELGGRLSDVQWVVNSYLLFFAATLLLGGSAGDIFGRRLTFQVSVAMFVVASVLCALSPTLLFLIVARAAQGLAAAFLVPSSFALLGEAFQGDDRRKAIRLWTSMVGLAGASGPLIGGLIVESMSWRAVFVVNVPLAVLAIVLGRSIPKVATGPADRRFDVAGSSAVTVGLGGIVWATIAAAERGWADAGVVVSGVVGLVALAGFLIVERYSPHPMLPLALFKIRVFSAVNLMTLLMYGAYGVLMLMCALFVQSVLGYSALVAGLVLAPIELCLLLLSPLVSALTQRVGCWVLLVCGPAVCVVGLLRLGTVGTSGPVMAGLLSGILIYAVGFAVTVIPLGTVVLGSLRPELTGTASAVNNAAARVGSLLCIAIVPTLAGSAGGRIEETVQLAFQASMLWGAALYAAAVAVAVYVVVKGE
jgi:EmrB/QacA subfamily drug resistance transporter